MGEPNNNQKQENWSFASLIFAMSAIAFLCLTFIIFLAKVDMRWHHPALTVSIWINAIATIFWLIFTVMTLVYDHIRLVRWPAFFMLLFGTFTFIGYFDETYLAIAVGLVIPVIILLVMIILITSAIIVHTRGGH